MGKGLPRSIPEVYKRLDALDGGGEEGESLDERLTAIEDRLTALEEAAA